MANITIWVSRHGTTNGIKLRDSEGHNPGNDHITTDVSPGDIITWKLEPSNSGLSSLDGVRKKSTSPNNLLTGAPRGNGRNEYTATVVSPSPGKDKVEDYEVGYTISGESDTRWDDPKIKMKV